MPAKKATFMEGLGIGLFLAFLCLVTAVPAEARRRSGSHVLIIQYGDSHSRYDRIIPFLAMVRKRIGEFRQRYPNGEVIIIASGDISALSSFSHDEGWLNTRFIHHLSRRYPAVWVQGNHEALDWRGVDGRMLYINQLREVTQWPATNVSPLHSGVVPLSANLKPTPIFARYLQAYRDIPIHGGKKTLRIIGLTLEDYFRRAVYDPALEPRLFEGINPLEMELHNQLVSASQDGVDWVIPAFHEEYPKVEALARKMAEWRGSKPIHARYKVPAIFAADDHKEIESNPFGTPIFDSGCEYVFRSVQLNRRGHVVRQQMHRPQDLTRQERRKLGAYLLPEDHDFIREHVRPALDLAKEIHSQKLGVVYETPDTRQDFKARRTELGTIIADSFRLYGEHILSTETGMKVPVICFFNSSTYRLEDPIRKQELTVGHLYAMLPYLENPWMAVPTGAQAQQRYSELRAYRATEGVHSPQMSSNLVEAPTEGEPYRLLFHKEDGTWVPLSEVPFVCTVTDHWLGEDGYKLKGWSEMLANVDLISPAAPMLELDLMRKFIPVSIRNWRARTKQLDLKPITCEQTLRRYIPDADAA